MKKLGEKPAIKDFVGRSEAVTETLTALRESAGAVLVGEPGIGKTALARQVLARLESGQGPQPYVVRIRGSLIPSTVPYAPLAFLLSSIDDAESMHPYAVRRALMESLQEKAAGAPIVLFVDNLTGLDASTLLLLEHMVRSEDAKLLATATQLTAGTHGLLQMWTEGLVRRIDLRPLDRVEARNLLENELGGTVSDLAAWCLWDLAGGNTLFLKLLAQEQATEGTIVKREGVWVKAAPLVQTGAIAEVVDARLCQLTDGQRRIVELLAAAVELPLAVLERLGDPDDLDVLQQLDLIDVRSEPGLPVKIRSRASGEIIRTNLPPGRSRALWEEIVAEVDLDALAPAGLLGVTSWGLSCGSEMEPAVALTAAQLANQFQDPEAALDYSRSVRDKRRVPDILLEEVRALLALGRIREAADALEELEGFCEPAEPHRWVPAMILLSRVCRALPERTSQAPDVLAKVRTEVFPDGSPDAESGLLGLWEQLVVAELDLASFDGRFRDLAPEALNVYADPAYSLDTRLRAGAYYGEAAVMTGRVDAGRAVAKELNNQLSVPSVAPEVQETILARYLSGHFYSSEFITCRQLLEFENESAGHNPQNGSAGEIFDGLIEALGGSAVDAAEKLTSAVQQLSLRDPEGMFALALAGAAFASGRRKGKHAPAALAGPLTVDVLGAWKTRATASYFELLAMADQAGTAETVAGLGRLADAALERGAVLPALFALAAAAGRGDKASAQRLQATAAEADGAFAELCRHYGSGLAGGNASDLLRAAELASAIGNHLLAREAAGAAAAAAGTGERAIAQEARRLEAASRRQLQGNRMFAEQLEALSDFERRLIPGISAGRTSAEMAAELHLSPRTVDWHLGRLFEKLNVSGRAELRGLLSDQQPL